MLELGYGQWSDLLILHCELRDAGLGGIFFHLFSPKYLSVCLAHNKLLNK